METREEELSRCREELAYWSRTENHYAIWYYTERIKELEGEENGIETIRRTDKG